MTPIERLLIVAAASVTILAFLLKPARQFFDWWYLRNHPDRGPKIAVARFNMTEGEERREQIERRRRVAEHKDRVRRYRITKGLEALFVLVCIGAAIFLFLTYWPTDAN